MDLHKRLPAMSLEHHKPLKLCQRSERITSSPSLLSWPSSLSLPSWLSSQVPPRQRPSSSTSLLSLLSLPSSPSWPSLPSSPSSPSWPSWEPFWEVRTVESGSEDFWRGLSHENKRHATSVEMWHLRCALNDLSVVADSSCCNGKSMMWNSTCTIPCASTQGTEINSQWLSRTAVSTFQLSGVCCFFCNSLLSTIAMNKKWFNIAYKQKEIHSRHCKALQAPVMQAPNLSSAQGLCTPSPWLYNLTRSYGPAQTPPCDVTWAPQTAQALPAQWTNHFIAFIAFMAFIAFIAFMAFIAGASSSTAFFIDFIAFIAFMAFIAFIAFIAFMAFMGAILGSANCWERERGLLERLEPWKQKTCDFGCNVTSPLCP